MFTEPLVIGGIIILIFGGAQFIVALIHFTIMHYVEKHRARKHSRDILRAAYQHYHSGL